MSKPYNIDEINSVAWELLQTLSELDAPVPLAIQGLCRAITLIGTQEDLDNACRLIDDMAELETEFDNEFNDRDSDDDE